MSIKEAIQAAVKGLVKIQTHPATVKSVNWNNRTAVVELPDGRQWKAMLRSVADGNADGLTLKPKVGSKVLVSIVSNQEMYCWISQYSEVEEIVLIDDSNGGLVKVSELVNRINALEQHAKTHTHGGVTAGGGTTATATPVFTNTTQISDLENPKVKH